jgi:isoamylase
LIHLRREHAIFRRAEFFEVSRPDRPPSSQEIIWHGLQPNRPDWSGQSRVLAFLLKDIRPGDDEDSNFLIMLNGQPDQAALFTVPETAAVGRSCVWKKIIDTGLSAPADFVELAKAGQIAADAQVSVAPMGCVVLQTEKV